MELYDFAQGYSQLQASEQSLFAETVRRLLSDGIIWREEEKDRRVYTFLQRYRELVETYLAVAGWDLLYNELLGIFRVRHRDGSHRRRLTRDGTIWLLLLRLLYAEKRESVHAMMTPNPVVQMSDIIARYTSYFPGQAVRKKTSLQEALRSFSSMKLVRVHRASSADPAVELLPTLEEVVPVNAITEVSARLEGFAHPETNGRENGSEPEDMEPRQEGEANVSA